MIDVMFPPVAIGSAALAGLGIGMILERTTPEKTQRRLGWALLVGFLPLSFVCFFFGLP